MLRSQSSSASRRVAESAAFQSRPNRPFWAPFSAQGSIPPATRGPTLHMMPRACAKAAVPGETAGGWPETGEVSMISSSPPAHASTRETHLRRCSSHPPLRLRSCPPRQRKQVASEGSRGAWVCPPADQQQPCQRHARWGTQHEESRWLHASFATPVAVRNRCSKEGAALEHNRAAGPMKVRLRTGLSTDV